MNEENERLLSFCTRIVATAQAIDRSLRETKGDAFVKRLHDSLPKVNTASAGAEAYAVQAGDTEEDAMKAYVDWATQVRFEYCDLTVPDLETEDGTPHYKFYYNNEARMLATSDIPKRSLAIAKEVRYNPSTNATYALTNALACYSHHQFACGMAFVYLPAR